MKDLAIRESQLKRRLSELDRRVHRIEDELESHNNPDWDDRAVERETDEVLESMGLSAQAEIAAIKKALSRIQSGDYGLCQSCGAEISAARLDVLPFTAVCKSCAGAKKHR